MWVPTDCRYSALEGISVGPDRLHRSQVGVALEGISVGPDRLDSKLGH